MKNIIYEERIKKLSDKLSKKIVIGNELIEYYDDEDFYKYVNEISENILKNAYYTTNSRENSDIIMISLIFITLKNYSENGTIWPYIKEIYKNLYDGTTGDETVSNRIREIIKRYHPETKGRDVNHLVMNTIVPVYYLKEFYEFIFDIYINTFLRTLPDNPEEELMRIYKRIKEIIKNEDSKEDLDIGGKTYKLIKGTKDIIADINNTNNINELINLSIKMLHIIDRDFWKDSNVQKIDNNYLYEGYNNWKSASETFKKEKENKVEKEQWKYTFSYRYDEGGAIYLNIPSLYVNPELKCKVEGKYTIEIKINDVLTDVKDVSVKSKRMDGGYNITSVKVPLEDPLVKIEYELCYEYGNKKLKISDTHKVIENDYLLFNTYGEQVSLGTIGNILVAYKIKDEIKVELVNVEKEDNFIKLETGYIIPIRELNEVEIKGENEEGVKAFCDLNEISLYKNVDAIVIKTEVPPENIVMSVNDKVYDFKGEKVKSDNLICINEIDFLDKGYNAIKFENNIDKKVIASKKLIYDKDLKYVYLDEFCVGLESQFQLYTEDKIPQTEWNIDYRKELTSNAYIYTDKKIYYYQIKLKDKFYRINKKEWRKFDEPICIDTLNIYSTIETSGLEYNEVKLYEEGGMLRNINIKNKLLQIGFLEDMKPKKKNSWFDIKFFNEDNEVIVIKAIKNAVIENIEEIFKYDQVKGKLYVNAKILGKSKYEFKLVKGNIEQDVKYYTDGNVELEYDISSVYNYDYYIYEVPNENNNMKEKEEINSKYIGKNGSQYRNKNYTPLSNKIPESFVREKEYKVKKLIFEDGKSDYDSSVLKINKKLKEFEYKGELKIKYNFCNIPKQYKVILKIEKDNIENDFGLGEFNVRIEEIKEMKISNIQIVDNRCLNAKKLKKIKLYKN